MSRAVILKKQRLVAIFKLLVQSYYLNRRGKKDAMYNLLGDELLKLGGVYIKFLQGVILQSWSMQRWRSDNKLDIFEDVRSPKLNAPKILKNNLGDKFERLTDLSSKPIAIGSFGHVYLAKLNKKDTVIVKLLSSEIRRTLKFDLRLLKFFYHWHLKAIKFNKGLNVRAIFNDFKKQTLHEIDYITEAEFADEQYHIYKDHPKLVIPKTYLELCTDEVIIQDYVKGLSVTKLLKLKEKKSDLDLKDYVKKEFQSDLVKQLQILAFEILWATFHQPSVMGDPHPGNVIIMDNNQIGLIDFGIKAQSSKYPVAYLKFIKAYNQLDEKNFNLEEFFVASLQFFGRDLYLALDKLGKLVPSNEKTATNFNQELARIMQRAFEAEFSKKDISHLISSPKALVIFDRLANKNNRFGFKLTVSDSEMLRTLVTLTGLIDLLNLYSEVMTPTYLKVIRKVETEYPDLKSLNETEISYSQAFNIAFVWLERVASHDPSLFQGMMQKLRQRSKILQKEIKQEIADS
ncbi:MAG: AarF/UbiB family protein [Candidatus Saccharibacteria bacterium]|nr:AarF/UbiB family protein [Candidatus Saccharibacteria bacterium]